MRNWRERAVALRKEGHSITEIVKATGRAKSSLYPYIRDIPLSDERIRQSRIAAAERIRKFSLARKGKSKRPFKPFDTWTRETVALVAHLLFDGGIYPNRGCSYNNRSRALLRRVEECMHVVYEFKPRHYTNPLTGVMRISYHNVALAGYMKKKVDDLLRSVYESSRQLKVEFIRAFFDDEGCIDYRPERNKRSVRGYQKNTEILKLIWILLRDLNIESRVILPNEVVITGKENLIRFERGINFSPGVYLNGNRSNSRWKRHIEKKELLRRAIKSYKT